MSKISFLHQDDDRITICTYIDNDGRIFTAKSRCHEEDKDFYSPLTGEIIAGNRALSKVYKASIKQLKNELLVLDNLLQSFKTGEKYAKELNSNMFKQVKRARYIKQEEIYAAMQLLRQNKEDLEKYLSEKEYFFAKVKSLRSKHESAGQN